MGDDLGRSENKTKKLLLYIARPVTLLGRYIYGRQKDRGEQMSYEIVLFLSDTYSTLVVFSEYYYTRNEDY